MFLKEDVCSLRPFRNSFFLISELRIILSVVVYIGKYLQSPILPTCPMSIERESKITYK